MVTLTDAAAIVRHPCSQPRVNPYRDDPEMAERDLASIGMVIGGALDAADRIDAQAAEIKECSHRGMAIALAIDLRNMVDDFRDDAVHQPTCAIAEADSDEYRQGRLDYDIELAADLREGE